MNPTAGERQRLPLPTTPQEEGRTLYNIIQTDIAHGQMAVWEHLGEPDKEPWRMAEAECKRQFGGKGKQDTLPGEAGRGG